MPDSDDELERTTLAQRAIRRRIAQRRAAKREPVTVHIGPNELVDGDVDALAVVGVNRTRAVFVEPQPGVIPSLRERLASGVVEGLKDWHVVNAAVCPYSTEPMTMYGFHKRLMEDYPAAARANLSHLSSLKRKWLIPMVRWSRNLRAFGLHRLCQYGA